MNDPYDYLFKFLVIGSAGTGKSCLLHQFIENRFKEESSHTIGKHLLDPLGLFASVPVSVPDPWHFGVDPDADPDPAIFVIDL
jgi:hypothetical protein